MSATTTNSSDRAFAGTRLRHRRARRIDSTLDELCRVEDPGDHLLRRVTDAIAIRHTPAWLIHAAMASEIEGAGVLPTVFGIHHLTCRAYSPRLPATAGRVGGIRRASGVTAARGRGDKTASFGSTRGIVFEVPVTATPVWFPTSNEIDRPVEPEDASAANVHHVFVAAARLATGRQTPRALGKHSWTHGGGAATLRPYRMVKTGFSRRRPRQTGVR